MPGFSPYPVSLDPVLNLQDNVDTYFAAHPNNLNAAVRAIEALIGTGTVAGITQGQGTIAALLSTFPSNPPPPVIDPAYPAISPAASNINSMLVTPTTIYLAGNFTSVGGQARPSGTAAINIASQTVTAWAPVLNAGAPMINSMELAANGDIYLGGTFTTVNGVARAGFAAVDPTTGIITRSLDLGATGSPLSTPFIQLVRMISGVLYVTGFFSNIGGAARLNFAAIDPTTGLVIPAFNLNQVNTFDLVYQVAQDSLGLWLTGNFSIINTNITRNNIAIVNPASGADTGKNFNFPSGGTIQGLALDGTGNAFLAGFNNTGLLIGSNNVLQIPNGGNNKVSGVDASVNPQWDVLDSSPFSTSTTLVLLSGTKLFTDGVQSFLFNGAFRRNFQEFDSTSAKVTGLPLQPDSFVGAMAVVGGKLYIAGSFTRVAGQVRYGLASLAVP